MTASPYKFECALLIDDDNTDLYINKRILELTRFAKKIIIKKSGREALDYFLNECSLSANIPEVVFLDFFMPVMSGNDFLNRYENLPERLRSKTRVVMLSVLDEEMHPDAIDKNRVFQSLSKPLTEEKLQVLFSHAVSFQRSL